MPRIDDLRVMISELEDEIDENILHPDPEYDVDSARCRLADLEDELLSLDGA